MEGPRHKVAPSPHELTVRTSTAKELRVGLSPFKPLAAAPKQGSAVALRGPLLT